MPKANLTKEEVNVISGKDGIIIRKYIYGVEAGRPMVLEAVDGAPAYPIDVIPCGTPIIKKMVSGVMTYKALAPTEGFVLPANWGYVGVASATVKATDLCPIMTAGVVNEIAMLANMKECFDVSNRVPTVADLAEIKVALPHLMWMNDETDGMPVTITDKVYINDETSWNANFAKLADYYAKNPTAPGYDGTYPDVKWAVANFSDLAGTMTIAYDGVVKATVPGITKNSTYVIIDPLADLGIAYAAFDLSKLVLTVKA